MAGTSVLKLKVDDKEYNSSLKQAQQGMQRLEQALNDAGKSFKQVDKSVVDYVRGIGQMEAQSKTARGRISEMSNAFVELSLQYKNMSDEVKSSDVGKALAESMVQLKQRTVNAKSELEGLNKELNNVKSPDVKGSGLLSGLGGAFGKYGQVVDTIGSKLGIAGNLTSMLTSKTALLTAGIGAATTVVAAGAKAWADYNDQLSRRDNATMVTTGLKGDEADRMTDAMTSVAKVYNVDFREAINAANTLMTQFGLSGDEAIQLIRDGMQGMIEGDGPKLLSMIQQYAPSFRDAGISASQLVAIIHNSEGGIFTDQNMNAIVMGIKNIRLMTNSTSEALAKLGIDGEVMTQKLNDGSMTIFEALSKVSQAIEKTGSGSQAAGEVMQTVFGRQGAAAGTKLGEAIATLNTNLEETKYQTGEVGEATAELEIATNNLNSAIRDCFGWDGWKEMSTGLKTDFAEGLTTILKLVTKIKKIWGSIQWTVGQYNPQGDGSDEIVWPEESETTAPYNPSSSIIADSKRKIAEAKRRLRSSRSSGGGGRGGRGGGGHTGGGTNPVEGSIDWQAKKVQDLQKAWRAAANDDSRRKIKAELDAQQNILEKMEGNQKSVLTQSTSRTELQVLQDQLRTVKEFQGAYGKATEEWKEAQKEINDITNHIIALNDNTLDLFNKPAAITADSVKSATTISKKDLEGLQLSYDRATSTTSLDDNIEVAQDIISGMSQVASGLQQMGVQLPEGVQKIIGFGQGLLSVIQGVKAVYDIFNTITATTQIASETANTTAMVGLTAAVIANTTALYANTAVGAIPFFKNGGIVPHAAAGYRVPGNDYADMTPIMVSSGEVILNKAQQGNLLSQMQQARDSDHGEIVARLSGEDILLVANRHLRRTGKGELVTWKS